MRTGISSRWAAAIIVCRKCEKKLGGGFGADGRKYLSKLLRKRSGGKGRKARVGVIESRCLKLCPKKAVTVINGMHPQDWKIVEAGTPIEEIEHRLGVSRG